MIDEKMIGERFTVRLDDGRVISGTVTKVTKAGFVVDGKIHLGPGETVVLETANERLVGEVSTISFNSTADIIDVTVRLEPKW